MLVGAISAFCVSFFFHSDLLGVLLGAAGGALLGLVMAFISISLKQDQILSGLGIYFLGLGLSGFLYEASFRQIGSTIRISGLPELPIPILSQDSRNWRFAFLSRHHRVSGLCHADPGYLCSWPHNFRAES